MRLKAIPVEVEHLAEAHPFVVGAAVVALGAGIYYYHNTRSPSDNLDADPVASTSAGFSYGMPMVIPQGAGTGMIDAITNPAAGGGDASSGVGSGATNLDLFNFAKLKEEHDYTIAQKTLDTQLQIALVNSEIALQGIQLSGWQTSAGLAAAFLRSGQQFFAGKVGDQTFAFLGTGAPYTGKKKKVTMTNLLNANFQSLLNSPTVQAIFSGATPNELQSQSGTMSVTPYGGSNSSSSGASGGGSSIASIISGASSGSTQPATYTPSAYETTAYGATGGGSASRIGQQSVSY